MHDCFAIELTGECLKCFNDDDSADARRTCRRGAIGSTMGAYPRDTGSNPVEGNGHFFPSYRQLYLSSFFDTHTRARTRALSRSKERQNPRLQIEMQTKQNTTTKHNSVPLNVLAHCNNEHRVHKILKHTAFSKELLYRMSQPKRKRDRERKREREAISSDKKYENFHFLTEIMGRQNTFIILKKLVGVIKEQRKQMNKKMNLAWAKRERERERKKERERERERKRKK